MRLHRDSPPVLPADKFTIGAGSGYPVILHVEPRRIEWAGASDPLPVFLPAFAKSCAVLWGEQWHGPLETVCGLRRGTAKKWMVSGTIPPPMIVGWVAYLSARSDARALGHALLAIAGGADMDVIREAWTAFKGMNDGR